MGHESESVTDTVGDERLKEDIGFACLVFCRVNIVNNGHKVSINVLSMVINHIRAHI
jgi:hypothetical protein